MQSKKRDLETSLIKIEGCKIEFKDSILIIFGIGNSVLKKGFTCWLVVYLCINCEHLESCSKSTDKKVFIGTLKFKSAF